MCKYKGGKNKALAKIGNAMALAVVKALDLSGSPKVVTSGTTFSSCSTMRNRLKVTIASNGSYVKALKLDLSRKM